ncbi:STAS/SEC14 domain-containing protein [Rhodocytophaga aerolata]|uniref:STAS/SEC14 domain-containing protein n=1 Tax=Rhodocytophaga aerolata TaxID=455078 RepID=A0ABT8R000_9BACT|nr:STAS/SEC14 domain-containing protein [Rhodocytophaga aerolata]MDO1445416.1 STAS/SEC14 domain-containing protein [Rhodocytophaga aerolata]
MFQYVDEHADNLVAVIVSGLLEKADYTRLLLEVENKINRYGKIDIYWEMVDVDGWDLQGILHELTFDLKHLNDINRAAIVGDRKWEEVVTNVAQHFTTAEVKFFEPAEREQAMTWVKEKLAN